MKSIEIRQKFFDFFIQRNHEKVASSSLIPAHNPTLLFTNAGMNQFTDVFLGLEKRSYTRATSIQKCVRAGGKHNDLENVGFTKRHLTFFEMMGNFSFGDYFKKDAIPFAWDFLTKEMNLPEEKLHITVYKTDDEAYDIWHKTIGIPTERMHRLGEKENFWQMGDTGPCGPCTEIHLDRGQDPSCPDPKNCGPACDCDRFLEIWNLVFMQFDRQPDGTDKPLKQTGVDTGMGLERLCTLVQNKDSVFETDLFANTMAKIEEMSSKKYAEQPPHLKGAFNVLADHSRSATMLIADGCAPSNDGRGYVLRKIIRRAALFAQKLTVNESLFPELSKVVVQDMGAIYPDLKNQQELVYKVLDSEVKKFATNLVRGQGILEKYFKENNVEKIINGQQTFKLYDTFGFPVELIKVIAQERGFIVDTVGFETEMAKQQEQSNKGATEQLHVDLDESITTEFTGYKELQTTSEIIALVQDGKVVHAVLAGTTCYVIAKKSPFFIVGGGQVPDQGWLEIEGVRVPLTEVRYINTAIAAKIVAQHNMHIGDAVTSIVNEPLRVAAMKNHTATHMLQSALIELFGNQIKQAGSLVHPDYLRFDFSYHDNLSAEDIHNVEELVNKKIRENILLNVQYMTLKEAQARGALAFFGDKYKPENVRMVEIPNFSTELCGGTHVHATGDIGTFKITEVTSPAAGQRRIFAVTGHKAIELFQETFDITKKLCQEFKIKREEIVDTVEKQASFIKTLQSEIKQFKKQAWKSQLPIWLEAVTKIGNIPYLFLTLKDFAAEDLRDVASHLGNKKPGFYFLISTIDDRITFLCTLSSEFASMVNLKDFATWLKDNHQLRGGGNTNSLQGGGVKFDSNLETAISEWLSHNQK
ncbi:MAG: alanine--tRNA ligase [Candidatus Dependentiae bacterium]|nr:alanine--tRNA ligase [Candidatus Dependentiae bacterium]